MPHPKSTASIMHHWRILIFVLFVFLLPKQVSAFRLIPSDVTFNNILRGTTQQKTLAIEKATSEIGNALFVSTSVTGEGAKAVDLPKIIELSANEKRKTYTINVNTGDFPNGTYKAMIKYTKSSDPNKATTTNSNSAMGARIAVGYGSDVTFTVTGDQKISFELIGIQIDDSETGLPLIVHLSTKNTGNVLWKPERVILKLQSTNLLDATPVIIDVPTNSVSGVQPGQYDTLVLETTHQLPEGEYNATIDIYQDGKVVDSQSQNKLLIFPPNTLNQNAELGEIENAVNELSTDEIYKLDIPLINTGKLPIKATPIFELTKNSKTLDLKRGDQMRVDIGSTGIIRFRQRFDEPGDYQISIYAEYGQKTTLTKKVSFKVTPIDLLTVNKTKLEPGTKNANSSNRVPYSYLFLIIFAGIIIFAVRAFVKWKYRAIQIENPTSNQTIEPSSQSVFDSSQQSKPKD